MELKPPRLATSTPTAYTSLQREAADRVARRYEEQRRKDRRRAFVARLKNIVVIVFLLTLVGGGFYAWQSGMLDGWLNAGMDARTPTPKIDAPLAPFLTEGDLKTPEVSSPEVISPKDEDREARDRNLDAYSEVVRQFRKAKVDYWKNAPDIDRPGKSGTPLKFWCLAVDENEVPVVLELSMSVDAKMKVRRLSASSGMVGSSVDEFTRLTTKNPYLVMREDRAYFSAKGKGRLPAEVPIPQKEKALNPGKIEFGALYKVLMEMGISSPKLMYDVMLNVKGGPVLKIATVRFGEEVTYGLFFSKVADHYGLSENEAIAIDAILKMGKARIVSADVQSKR